MNKKRLFLLTALIFVILCGCGNKDTADKYVGEQITAVKEGSSDKLSLILDDGISESNELYVLQFPDELKEPYLDFMKEAFKSIEFEVEPAKENGENSYSVRVSFSPLDIGKTTEQTCNDYLSSMSSSDLTEEVSALLGDAQKAIAEDPVYSEEKYTTLTVTKGEDGFSVSDEDMKAFLEQVLLNYMQPYDAVCELLNEQDFLKAYLDASFKGEVSQFARHTNRTEEEAVAWYEEEVFDPPEDLVSSYSDRYKEAMKTIFKQCKYTVGIPQKDSGAYSYTVDVTVIPNTSLVNVTSELNNGTYYSVDDVSRNFVESLEKYAASPTYGDETVVTVSLNYQTLAAAGEDDTDLTILVSTILPYE